MSNITAAPDSVRQQDIRHPFENDSQSGSGAASDMAARLAVLTGYGRNDALNAFDADAINKIDGTEADDTIGADGGYNKIYGHGGNDTVSGGHYEYEYDSNSGLPPRQVENFDWIYGEHGDDVIYGDDVAGSYYEHEDYDDEDCGCHEWYTLIIEGSDDYLNGGPGNDTLEGRWGGDRIEGGEGDDLIQGDELDDTLVGGPGDDRIDGGEGHDTADYASTTRGVSVRLATGTASGDAGEVGSDTLLRVENVTGGSGSDRLIGNAAANRLVGNDDGDLLEGGKNNDTLLGGTGADTLAGALDHDLLEGGAGLDFLRGDSGDDTLLGGDNNDRLVGGAGNDRLEGDGGADQLRGESGSDILIGGGAGDRLYGGCGADVLTGGAAADRFFLTAIGESGTSAATRDVIADFEVGADVVNLSRIDAVQGGGNDAFVFIGADVFTAAGQLRSVQDAANDRTIVEGNVNAGLAADFQIELTGLHGLTAGDFVL